MFARGRPQVSPTDTHINIGRELVFSADLCYNGDNEKASPFGRGGGVADGEGELRQYSLSPAIAGALPMGEPLDACNLRGMGFAQSLCNTKAKLAIKQNDK